MSTQRYNQYQ